MKNFFTTYLAVVFGGITLMLLQDILVQNKLNQIAKATSYAETQSYDDRKAEQERREAQEKTLASSASLRLCKAALLNKHGKPQNELEVIRNTPTFVAFNYEIAGVGYHSKCIVDDRNRVVSEFDFKKR